ncbi:MAG: tRNA (guanosine(46)-N7)-methyltransferase TrmB [Parvularcula sp.]|nr:tRNA (guanosine(46)-N7)-methyltransferase TrmB [Parvularcula sp.]
MADEKYIPRLYGRQQDKPLKPRQARLMETLLPRIAVPVDGPIDPAALFPQAEEIHLEVGFGGGEHLAWQAAHQPKAGFIGAEPFVNGVGKLLGLIDDEDLDNVRVHHGDARPLLEALPDACLARIYVLHPDPWPKKRHHKRRMISPWFFHEATRLLKSGGELRVASDIRDYIRWTLMHAQNADAFEWTAERAADWKDRPEDWPQTRYEAKSLREGRTPSYLVFRRK